MKIEDYAIIGNMRTAALVGNQGSIDWLCIPRFDSGACFAALLGNVDNGRWLIAPQDERPTVSRRYREGTLILETEFVTDSGAVTLIDFMPVAERRDQLDVIRIVTGTRGTVAMRMEVLFRFDYGHVVPGSGAALTVSARSPVPTPFNSGHRERLQRRDFRTIAEFTVKEGQTVPFSLTWYPSNEQPPRAKDPRGCFPETESWWQQWSSRCTVKRRPWSVNRRSFIALKALTYRPPAGSWPRPPPRCPRCQAACAIGITAFAGSAMRLSRFTRC